MKQIKKWFLVVLLLVCFTTVVGCKQGGKDPVDPEKPTPSVKLPTISLTLGSETIKQGEQVSVTVKVTDAKSEAYTISFSDATLLAFKDGKISVIKQARLDKFVTVTATLDENTTVSASATIKYVAPQVEGSVGDLTSEMIATLGNSSLTVEGFVTDVHKDFNQAYNSYEEKYELVVKMSDGAWYGSWFAQNKKKNVVTDNYRKGPDGAKNPNSLVSQGHELQRVIINKNNEVEYVTEKDYLSLPGIWENQHLWNHLGQLDITKFEYDAENDVYNYNVSATEEDLFLMTYIAVSLTPMLGNSDTLVNFYFVVEDGKITKIGGQTAITYVGGESAEDASAMDYTTVELTLKDVGTTVVPEPAAYEAPQNVDKLASALAKMQQATNYTYHAVDTTTYAPVTDAGDYQIESVSSVSQAQKMKRANPLMKVRNNLSATGTVGAYGQITEDAVLIARTTKYDATADGKDYRTEYTGMKKNNDNTYDEFIYYKTTEEDEDGNVVVVADGFQGKRKVTGTFANFLPKFDFSPNLFKYDGSEENDNGDVIYKFTLRETAITRAIALEISMYNYATDAYASASNTLTLVVDGEGNLISSIYPYNLNDTYRGYVSTTYKQVGTTKLDDDTFEGYIPRTIPTSWDQYTIKYYSSTHSTLNSHEEAAGVVIDAIWGDNKSDLPSPAIFHTVFNDNISGGFYDWIEIGANPDGTPIYRDSFGLTARSDYYDENSMVTNFQEIYDKLVELLTAEGFTLDLANTDISGGSKGTSDRYISFFKGECQVVIENNRTKNFWIDFYKTGEWSLNR